MVDKFMPELNKVYFINNYTLCHILEGSGGIQVDFSNYHDWRDKLIFLEKGQYIKFLSDNFIVRRIEFPDEVVFRNKEVRVLFKHLVSLGYIDFNECETCQKYLAATVFSKHSGDIIDVSTEQWFWQNPFHAKREEYHIIFDVKDVIDQEYRNHLNNEDLTQLINSRGYDAHALFKTRIGISVRSILAQKRLLESKKEIAFTDKSIKEVAYELGYKDPAYFNRVFKKMVGQSPRAFREQVDHEQRDSFLPELFYLLENYHQEEREIAFYAKKMHLSVRTLSRKVKERLSLSLGQLIRQELINTAKDLLGKGLPVNEVAYQLGFTEANHFSSFFRLYTGISPTEYVAKKYND